MKVDLPTSGRYIVAVSGGVDSVSLLHYLCMQPNLELVVAHFDHGIRNDSVSDRQFVEQLADDYGLPFIYETVTLGSEASEAAARTARYQFLRGVLQKENAHAIITAHHQDDLLETAIINLLRGTGRKGLTSLQNRSDVVRPLLQTPKEDILNYAQKHTLEWREDSTNRDTRYQRNYVRHRLLPRFSEADKQQLLAQINRLQQVNPELDTLLAKYLQLQGSNDQLKRHTFNELPVEIADEVMASWLRAYGIGDFDRQTIARLVKASKVAQPGKQYDVLHGVRMRVKRDYLALEPAER